MLVRNEKERNENRNERTLTLVPIDLQDGWAGEWLQAETLPPRFWPANLLRQLMNRWEAFVRKRIILALPVLALFCASALAQECSELCGTWELVSLKWENADGTSGESTSADLRSMKVMNSTHFSLTRSQADMNFDAAHSGRYTLKDGIYTEHIEQASNPYLLGNSFSFKSEVDGDTWKISGSVGDLKLEEVWRRVGSHREGS